MSNHPGLVTETLASRNHPIFDAIAPSFLTCRFYKASHRMGLYVDGIRFAPQDSGPPELI